MLRLNCLKSKVWEKSRGKDSGPPGCAPAFFSSSATGCAGLSAEGAKGHHPPCLFKAWCSFSIRPSQCLTWVFHSRTKPLWKPLYSQERKEVRALLTVFLPFVAKLNSGHVQVTSSFFFFINNCFIWAFKKTSRTASPNTHTHTHTHTPSNLETLTKQKDLFLDCLDIIASTRMLLGDYLYYVELLNYLWGDLCKKKRRRKRKKSL